MTLYLQNVVYLLLSSNLCIRFIHFGAFPEESIILPNLQALPRMLVLPAAAKSPKSAAALKIHLSSNRSLICWHCTHCKQRFLSASGESTRIICSRKFGGEASKDQKFTQDALKDFTKIAQTPSNACKKGFLTFKSLKAQLLKTLFKEIRVLSRECYEKNQIAWFQISYNLPRAGSLSKWSMKSMFWANEKLSLMVAWSLSVSIFCFRVQNST